MLINKLKKQINIDFLKKIAYPILVGVMLVVLWELSILLFKIESFLLPSFFSVIGAFMEVWSNGVLLGHIGASLFRLLSGFLIASFFAIPAGLLIGFNRYLNIAFDPLIQIVRTISPISWIPLAILWFGTGNSPAIFIIFITAFFPILISTSLAVKNVDPLLIKVGLGFNASNMQMIFKIILPAVMPYIIIGLKVSLGISWVIIVAAEMVGMNSGLGYMILDARNFLKTDLIIAGMLVIGVIGFIMDKLFLLGERFIKMKLGFFDGYGNS